METLLEGVLLCSVLLGTAEARGAEVSKVPEVQFREREKLFETVILVDENSDPEWGPYREEVESYRIGAFVEGRYKGADLVLVRVHRIEDRPCKGETCERPLIRRMRYVKREKEMILLPKNSELPPENENRPLFIGRNPFEEFGVVLDEDASYSVSQLEYPANVIGPKPRQSLSLIAEEEGNPDLSQLQKVFDHPIFGPVFTTRFELSATNTAYREGTDTATERATPASCYDSSCFTTNAFFIFRPDGTFLRYAYREEADLKLWNAQWTNEAGAAAEFSSQTHVDCSGTLLDELAVTDPAVLKPGDLVEAGRTAGNDPLYALKSPSHKLSDDLYDFYSRIDIYDNIGKKVATRETKEEFFASLPILFWKDPFDRWIRLTNTEFLPRIACEPVIYLYPEDAQAVEVVIEPAGGVGHSTPRYADGWRVTVDRAGRIRNEEGQGGYRYLFWEGATGIVPEPAEGFVVPAADVEAFFRSVLPRLGLNPGETNDFLEAWLPTFSGSPYYFIAFFDPAVIDRFIPLKVEPRPDTIIRVLMDYRPLSQAKDVRAPELPPAPVRRGFTAVEWGGLKR